MVVDKEIIAGEEGRGFLPDVLAVERIARAHNFISQNIWQGDSSINPIIV